MWPMGVLVTALLGGSLIGSVNHMLPARTPLLKWTWRFSSLVAFGILCSPFYVGYKIIARLRRRQISRSQSMFSMATAQEIEFFIRPRKEHATRFQKVCLVMLSSSFQILWLTMTFYSFLNTPESHAYALTRLPSVATVLFMILTRQDVSR